jgi:hypothetical protein
MTEQEKLASRLNMNIEWEEMRRMFSKKLNLTMSLPDAPHRLEAF